MSSVIGVPRSETRVVRLFAIGEPVSAESLKTLLGASHLDPAHVDIFDPADLGEGGLFAYLTDGMGIPATQVDLTQIQALSGTIALVRSAAFKGRGQSLRPELPVRLVASYREVGGNNAVRKLRSNAAKGTIAAGAGKRSDRAMSGRIAMIALAVMLLLAAVMVWVA